MAVPLEKVSLQQTRLTPEEYLAFEREAVERHEYVEGRVYKMAGESLAHSRICINIAAELRTQLRGTSCEVLSPNMKVSAVGKGMFAYPDATIVCGAPQFHDIRRDVLINPTALFEVLSSSTEDYDRTDKFRRYRFGCETMQHYILISQQIPSVEHFYRQSSGAWAYLQFFGLEQTFDIKEIGVAINLRDIYDRVEIQPQDEDDEAAEQR